MEDFLRLAYRWPFDSPKERKRTGLDDSRVRSRRFASQSSITHDLTNNESYSWQAARERHVVNPIFSAPYSSHEFLFLRTHTLIQRAFIIIAVDARSSLTYQKRCLHIEDDELRLLTSSHGMTCVTLVRKEHGYCAMHVKTNV